MLNMLALIQADTKFNEHYNAQNYTEALNMLQQMYAEFPSEEVYIRWQHARTLIAMNKTDEAMKLLNEGLTAGYWYEENLMQTTEPFTALRGNPAYDGWLLQNNQLRANFKPELQIKVITPENKDPRPPLLIALHGNGGNIDRFESFWVMAARLGWMVAMVQSTQPSRMSHLFDWNNVEHAHADVLRAHDHLCNDYTCDLSRVVLIGFSMGANIAFRMALSGQLSSLGFIAVEAWFPDVSVIPLIVDRNRNPKARGYLIAGRENTDYWNMAEHVYLEMGKHHLPCKLEGASNKLHGFAAEFDESLAKALHFVAQR